MGEILSLSGKWIHTTHAVPKDDEYVLAYTKYGEKCVAYIHRGVWTNTYNHGTIPRPDYWQLIDWPDIEQQG